MNIFIINTFNRIFVCIMEYIQLPTSLVEGEMLPNNPDIFLSNYNSRPPFPKNQVSLETNLLSFSLNGYKELWHYNSRYKTNGRDFVLVKSGHCLMSEKGTDSARFRWVAGSEFCYI